MRGTRNSLFILPRVYYLLFTQNFASIDGVPPSDVDFYGGSYELSDYCPTLTVSDKCWVSLVLFSPTIHVYWGRVWFKFLSLTFKLLSLLFSGISTFAFMLHSSVSSSKYLSTHPQFPLSLATFVLSDSIPNRLFSFPLLLSVHLLHLSFWNPSNAVSSPFHLHSLCIWFIFQRFFLQFSSRVPPNKVACWIIIIYDIL